MDNETIQVLSSHAVELILCDCLCGPDEPVTDPIIIEGYTRKYSFHPTRTAKNANIINVLLGELPEKFRVKPYGGMSVIHGGKDRHGKTWANSSANVENLFCLGIAIGSARWLVSRSRWHVLPEGLPYAAIF